MGRLLGSRLVGLFLQLAILIGLMWSFRREMRKLGDRVASGCPRCGYAIAGQPKPVCSECGGILSASEFAKIGIARATPRFLGYGVIQAAISMFVGCYAIDYLLEIRRVLMFGGDAFIPGYSLFAPQDASLFVVVLFGIAVEVAIPWVTMSLAMNGLDARKRAIYEVATRLEAEFDSERQHPVQRTGEQGASH